MLVQIVYSYLSRWSTAADIDEVQLLVQMKYSCWSRWSKAAGLDVGKLLFQMEYSCWSRWSVAAGVDGVQLLVQMEYSCWHRWSTAVGIDGVQLLAQMEYSCWHRWSTAVGIEGVQLLFQAGDFSLITQMTRGWYGGGGPVQLLSPLWTIPPLPPRQGRYRPRSTASPGLHPPGSLQQLFNVTNPTTFKKIIEHFPQIYENFGRGSDNVIRM